MLQFLFIVWMYCIFSTLPLDVENTVIHTMNSEGAFLVLPYLCFYGRMFEDFTDSIGSVDSFFPIFRFLINGFRFFSFFLILFCWFRLCMFVRSLGGVGFCVYLGIWLSIVWMYCIFSTLPLDVENAVIHTLNFKMAVFDRCILLFFSKIYILWE